MTTLEIYGIDHLRDAIKRGEVCEITTVQSLPAPQGPRTLIDGPVIDVRPKEYVGERRASEDPGPLWARAAIQAGIVLIFVAVMGVATIGGVAWLNANGLPWAP